jgi:flagellar biosynthesis/type III secretory pathway M-ring protein FliF/YscJ
MKKWVGPFISLFLILILGIGLVYDFFPIVKKRSPEETRLEAYQVVPIENEGEKGEADPHMLQLLKEIQKKLDEWLKSLNERIESEDVSRFKVRFLEILRNILEWIKEKVDAKIESYEKEKPKKQPGRGLFQETYQEILPFSKMG